ncbi:Clavaminate synthase-like protein [Mycena crocata]|nr:Clavaminate synthase-like protein [Mycena crocata]
MSSPEAALKHLEIAVVDFPPFLDGSNKQAVADSIIGSFKTIGFVYLLNHAIPLDSFFFLVIKKLFALPSDVKMSGSHPPSNLHRRHHRAMHLQHHYGCGREDEEDQPNTWFLDESLPGFKKCSEKFARLDAHADYDSITLLFQDDCGGLEIEDPGVPGLFRPVPVVPGALIVNVGDFMMHWSNDTIRSTIHRVRPPPGACTPDGMILARYPSPTRDYDTVVDCIPGTWDAERPKKYRPLSVSHPLSLPLDVPC